MSKFPILVRTPLIFPIPWAWPHPKKGCESPGMIWALLVLGEYLSSYLAQHIASHPHGHYRQVGLRVAGLKPTSYQFLNTVGLLKLHWG